MFFMPRDASGFSLWPARAPGVLFLFFAVAAGKVEFDAFGCKILGLLVAYTLCEGDNNTPLFGCYR